MPASPAPIISVLLPSRARPESLAASIASLRDLAAEPERIEILVAADPDDTATQAAAKKLKAKLTVAPERYGYSRLHEYINALAAKAKGRWLLLWNDDALMRTEGWDTEIRRREHADIAVLWPRTNHPDPHVNVFPIVAAKAIKAIGHFSMSPHCDSWVQDLGRLTGLMEPVDVEILHDRFDLTGGHDDDLHRENTGAYRTAEYHAPEMAAARQADAEKIRAAWGTEEATA